MASAAATHIIFLILAVIVAASVGALIIQSSLMVADEAGRQARSMAGSMETDLAIINDPRSVPHDDAGLTLYVKNVGTAEIDPAELSVFLDGVYAPFETCLLHGAASWSPGRVLQLNVTAPALPAGDHHVTVVFSADTSDRLDFHIGDLT